MTQPDSSPPGTEPLPEKVHIPPRFDEDIAGILINNPAYEAIPVPPEGYTFNPHLLMTGENQDPYTRDRLGQPTAIQGLCGVIVAGDELFGIVQVVTPPNNDRYQTTINFIITRFMPENNAELIGVLDPSNPIIVGRSGMFEPHNTMSREHFSIGIGAEGIVIRDLGSTNKTRLIKAREDQQPAAQNEGDFSVTALKRRLPQATLEEAGSEDQWDPLEYTGNWCARPSELVPAVNDMLNASLARRGPEVDTVF